MGYTPTLTCLFDTVDTQCNLHGVRTCMMTQFRYIGQVFNWSHVMTRYLNCLVSVQAMWEQGESGAMPPTPRQWRGQGAMPPPRQWRGIYIHRMSNTFYSRVVEICTAPLSDQIANPSKQRNCEPQKKSIPPLFIYLLPTSLLGVNTVSL